MGFRYRKSINIGGGFRINLSKSGIGYSWGVKGARFTKKANGGTRTTYSIPGTGISYVKETGGKKSANSKTAQSSAPETYDTRTIENDVTSSMVSEGLEEMLDLASTKLRNFNLILIALIVSLIIGCAAQIIWIISLVLLIFLLYYRKKQTIELQYTIEDDIKSDIDKIMQPFIEITKCDKVWRINQTSKNANRKKQGGAANLINRELCKTSTKMPFPFTTDLQVAAFKIKKETVVFLPDKVFVFKGAKIGALNYDDIDFSVTPSRFIESEKVPKDATVVDYTWEYVNKSNGGPDKRYKNNRKLPICLYGKLTAKSNRGLNTVIMFSKLPSK